MELILVTGATGNVGRRVVSELRSRGAAVRAFVRDPAKAAEVVAGDIEIAVGDFSDPESLREALTGVERIFLTSANGPDEVAHEIAVIDAAAAASVQLLVKLSALGAEVASPLPGLDWHGQIEQYLKQRGLPSVVLQANLFMSNLLASADAIAGGTLPAPAGDGRVSFVDPADIAAVAAAVLIEGRSLRAPLVLTGPSAISHAEIADELAAATGHPVRYVDMSAAAAHQAFTEAGLPPWAVSHVEGAYRLIRAGRLAATTDIVQRYLGRPARSIGLWARTNAEIFGRSGTSTNSKTNPEDVGRRFLDLVNAGDLDGLQDLYEADAVLHWPVGQIAEGTTAIRRALTQLLEVRPTMKGDVDQVLLSGDLALTSGRWTLEGTAPDGSPITAAGRTADVLRRQPDGTWRMVIDNPRSQ